MRQWSYLDTKIATFFGVAVSCSDHSIPKRSATRGEGALEGRAPGREAGQVEHRALEEAPARGIRRVLIERDDVRPVLGEHSGDGGHDAGLVLAGDQEAGGVGLGHACDSPGGSAARANPDAGAAATLDPWSSPTCSSSR